MSSAKVSPWTVTNTPIKIGTGLPTGELLATPLGPAGLGLAANLHQLITVFSVLAGADVSNGVTKYVAQCHDNPQQLRYVTSASSAMVLDFSTLMALIFVLAAALISQGLLGNTDYQGLVCSVALAQTGVTWGNLLLALMEGFYDAADNTLSPIISSLTGILAYYVSYRLDGYEGVLLGPALIPALVMIPAAVTLIKRGVIPLSYLKSSWDDDLAGQLSKLALVASIMSATLPVVYIMMYKLLMAQYSWDEVRIWQGVSGISDTYLRFIMVSFSVYLLSMLSRLMEKCGIAREVIKLLEFILPTVTAASFVVWLLCDFVIWLLLSNEFTAMRDLFTWQLVGDVLEVGAYVFGYLVVAKASLRFYILAEISQFTLLMVLVHWLVPAYGALGAVRAYMATYVVYFSLCCDVFLLWRRRA